MTQGRPVEAFPVSHRLGMQRNSERIIGVDPGLNVTGYGLVERNGLETKLVEAGVIRLPRSEGTNLPLRLETLFHELCTVLEEFQPVTMCLEEVYSHVAYPRTSILMGHARGVICLAARLHRIPVASFSAKRIKQAVTGNGNASKLQVQRTVQQYFGLDRLPRPSDVADALAAALCFISCGGRKLRSRTGHLRSDLAALVATKGK
jgi:crossover junction endodeoxyribonuclease RuvC